MAGFDLGNATNYIFNAYSNNIQLKDDFGWVRGRHSLKFGFDAINKRFIYYNPSGDKGQFTFSRFFTPGLPAGKYQVAQAAQQAAGRSDRRLEFADYLLGAYSSTTADRQADSLRGPSAVSRFLFAGFLARHQQADPELRPALRILEPLDGAAQHNR